MQWYRWYRFYRRERGRKAGNRCDSGASWSRKTYFYRKYCTGVLLLLGDLREECRRSKCYGLRSLGPR